MAGSEYVIEMLNITKEFPGIKANDNITLQLRRGEIHALLGENGAGKSTLMSVLFGPVSYTHLGSLWRATMGRPNRQTAFIMYMNIRRNEKWNTTSL